MWDLIEERMESPVFWIVCVVGVGLEILGWIISMKYMEYSLPIWQLIILVIGTIIASLIFGGSD